LRAIPREILRNDVFQEAQHSVLVQVRLFKVDIGKSIR
jgi:hypothetical protein